MIRTLAWKEYREHRAVWVAMLGLTAVFVHGLAYLLAPQGIAAAADRLMPLVVIVISMAGIYGLVCGAMMLAGEHEAKTLTFLETLPARRTQLWVIKVTAGLALALTQGLALAAVMWPLGLGPSALAAGHWFWLLPAVACEGFVWGLCGSALCRNVLTAVVLAFVLFLACWAFCANIFALALLEIEHIMRLPAYSEVHLAPVLSLYGAGLAGLCGSWAVFCRRDWERKTATQTGTGDDSLSVLAGLRALLWLTVRQGRVLALSLAVVGLLLGFLLPVYGLVIWPAFTLLAGVLCGTWMFASEQTEESYRFLGGQRLPLGRFWLVKLSCWLAVAMGVAFLTLLGAAIRVGAGDEEQWIHATYSRSNFVGHLLGDSMIVTAMGLGFFQTVWLVYGFAIGQVIAIVSRKSAVGVVIALLVSLLVVGLWLPSLLLGGMRAWQVLAVPLLLLAAGRLFLWAWAGARLGTRRPALGLAACGGVAAAWIAGNLYYRPLQVQDVGAPVDAAAYEASLPTPEKNKAGRLIQQAATEFTAEEKKPGAWPQAEPKLGRWIERMFESAWPKHLEEAAALPLGVVADPLTTTKESSLAAVGQSGEMARLLTDRALQLQARGDGRAALDHLVWALALSRNLRHRALQMSYRTGRGAEETALRGLDQWLDKLGPRPKLLRRALNELTRHEDQTPPPTEYLEAEYVNLLRRFDAVPHELFPSSKKATSRESLSGLNTELVALAWQTPWERARQIRRLNEMFTARLDAAGTPYWELPEASGVRRPWPFGPGPEWGQQLLYSAAHIEPGVRASETLDLCRVRAARMRLALALHEAENGKPAKRLRDLVPRYLTALPADPFSGKPFHYRVSNGERIDRRREVSGTDEHGDFQRVAAGQGVLWSVGPDLVDDGGVKDGSDVLLFAWSKSSGLDLIFLVPQWPGR